jgi:AdoMet-dependent heme synthase
MNNFDQSPFLVIWEVTQACDLACLHCRASALPAPHPLELTTRDGLRLLSEIRKMGNPLVVFTGGDPLKRSDLLELLKESIRLGLRTTVTPSATPLLTCQAVRSFRDCGVSRMAISLDGHHASSHDSFRQVAGSFERTLLALAEARRIRLETQVNTTVTQRNISDLHRIAEIVAASGAKLWSVFFLVVTGRACLSEDISAEQYEEVFELLCHLSRSMPFDIKTTEAQHYRRYIAQQRKVGDIHPGKGMDLGIIQRQAGINDGKGFLFVSHTGEIFPSGFLPVSAGNVRRDSLAAVYRDSPLFVSLRDSSRLKGKCGRCVYRNLCGGSRSRAFAASGDYLAEDPRCVYQPSQDFTFPSVTSEGPQAPTMSQHWVNP